MKAGSVQGLATCATTDEALQAFADLFDKVEGEAGLLEPVAPPLGFGAEGDVRDILDADFIVVAGAQPLEYQRVIGYFIHRAADQGATVAVIAESENELSDRADMTVSYAEADKVAKAAADAEKIVLVYSLGIKGKVMAEFRSLADKLSYLALSPARTKGGEVAGLKPAAFNGAATKFVLVSEQAENPAWADAVGDGFTVVQASYYSPLVERADVVLPTPLWYERTGSVTNIDGDTKPVAEVLPMPEGLRDDAEVLKTLADMI
jgi:formate dehydrogenase major subunit